MVKMTNKNYIRGMSKGRPQKYPWKRWLDRKTPVTLNQGTEYDIKTSSMCVMIRDHAMRMGLVVSVYPKEDNTVIQIVPRRET